MFFFFWHAVIDGKADKEAEEEAEQAASASVGGRGTQWFFSTLATAGKESLVLS